MHNTLEFPAQIECFEGAWPRVSGRLWLLCGLMCLLCAGLLLFLSPVSNNSDYWPAIGIGCGIASICVIALLRVFGFAWQSAPVAYIAVLWMFHFPLTLLLHLIPDLWTELGAPVYGWTHYASWYRGSLYALVCVIAFAVGCGLAGGSRPHSLRTSQPNRLEFYVGIATSACGLSWLYVQIVRVGGFDLFGSGYAQLYSTVFGPSFSNAIFLVSVGCFLAFLSAPRALAWLPVALQLACSVPVLLTGSRQFALIGPLVLAVLAGRRGVRLGLLRTGISCLLMLWVISYVGGARGHGVVEGVVGERSVGPVNALMEMGGSLETTSLALDWIQNGDAYLLGGSYWLPFERGLGLLLPSRNDLDTDPRAMHMVMVSRVAGLGGSAIAESYYNFSIFGTVFFLLLGFLLSRMEAATRSPLSASLAGVVLYAFIFQARNWFISVPSLIFLGSLPLACCICLKVLLRRREELQ